MHEALQQCKCVPARNTARLSAISGRNNRTSGLLGLLANCRESNSIRRLQSFSKPSPELHYAVSLLWSFMESWIARNWEAMASEGMPLGKEKSDDSA